MRRRCQSEYLINYGLEWLPTDVHNGIRIITTFTLDLSIMSEASPSPVHASPSPASRAPPSPPLSHSLIQASIPSILPSIPSIQPHSSELTSQDPPVSHSSPSLEVQLRQFMASQSVAQQQLTGQLVLMQAELIQLRDTVRDKDTALKAKDAEIDRGHIETDSTYSPAAFLCCSTLVFYGGW